MITMLTSLPLWLTLSLVVLGSGSLTFVAWYTTHQSLKKPALDGPDLLIQNGVAPKAIAITLAAVALICGGALAHIAFEFTDAKYARITVISAWMALFFAMLFSMLHFVRMQLLVTPEYLYIRRAIGSKKIRYQEIHSIHHIDGEPWFEINLKYSPFPIRVSKEMSGWQHASERIQHYAGQAGSKLRITIDHDTIRLIRIFINLFR